MSTRSLIVLMTVLCSLSLSFSADSGPIPIDGSRLPVTLDAPGSYVLAADLDCRGASGDCVRIVASNVSLDLAGFAIRNAGAAAIAIDSVEEVSVVHGFLAGSGGAGLLGTKSSGLRIEGVEARNNGGSGFVLGEQALMRDCRAADNGSHGFELGQHTRVADSLALDNAGDGFRLDSDALATACLASRNGGSGFEVTRGASGVTLDTCVARSNAGHGISVTDRCVVRSSTSERNGSGSGHAGVHVSGAENRVDGNHVAGNGIGILVEDSVNLIVRNSATGNGDNYDIVSCNDVGPIGFASGATSPWANIEH